MREYFLRLVAHEAWANLTLLEALRKENSVAERARDAFAHICAAPGYWMRRLQGEYIKDYEWWPAFEPETLRQRILDNEQTWTEYLKTLPEPVEEFRVETISHKGVSMSLRVVDILTQYHNHSCHHRGQIAVMFREAGLDPIVTDYIVWTRTQSQ